MALETTLIILKPDAVQRGLTGQIISRIEAKGLCIVGAKLMQITPELAGKHYAVHAQRPFYQSLVSFMTSAPVWVLAVRGNRAIEVMRKLLGKTNGCEAEPGTIRGDFGCSKSMNLVHGSDSPESAATELKLFFKAEELVDAVPDRVKWILASDD